LLEKVWVDPDNKYDELLASNDPARLKDGMNRASSSLLSVKSCGCGGGSRSNCLTCRLASVKQTSSSPDVNPDGEKRSTIFKNPFQSQMDPALGMDGEKVDTASAHFADGFEDHLESVEFDSSVKNPSILAFDGIRSYMPKYYSMGNVTAQKNRKHFVRTDDNNRPVQELFGFVNLNAFCRGGMYFIDRCIAKEGITLDYPHGRDCVIMRVMLTACCVPHEAAVICYLDSTNLYSMFAVVRLCKSYSYIQFYLFFHFLVHFIPPDDANVARLYTLKPKVTYEIDHFENLFLKWINLTRFIYDPERRVRFTAPEKVWSENDLTVRDKYPTMLVKEGETDADVAKWLSNFADDMKGSSRCFLQM
jgi:hypothetical protein